MQDGTLTLTGGWAIFAITCIIYFIANIVYGFGLLIEKQIKKKRTKRIETNETDWQHYRIQAAIEFAAQILANHGGAPTSVAKDAVDYADALVEELKRSDYVYAECRRLAAINTASVCENMTKIQEELQKKQD